MAGWRLWELMTQPDTNRVSEEELRGMIREQILPVSTAFEPWSCIPKLSIPLGKYPEAA